MESNDHTRDCIRKSKLHLEMDWDDVMTDDLLLVGHSICQAIMWNLRNYAQCHKIWPLSTFCAGKIRYRYLWIDLIFRYYNSSNLRNLLAIPELL